MHKIWFSFVLFWLILTSANAQEYRNPVIPGFHPDPSVCRVGDDYYLVNSSFQYFPGVPIFHSKDLVRWEQIGNVLDRESQLPLKGATSWLGIYAPTIRYHEGTFYMITTNVGNGGNFMVTAKDPRGPWSEPIWLKQQGIDPSLYFENGKCYMVSNPDNTIMLCEIDPQTGEQLTESKALWQGTGGRYPEGPHIYKKDGYYYLLISEGGTELAHSLTIARSTNIEGPYESNPANPILTNCSMKGQDKQIQGTGHGDFIQAADGSWWMVFLAYRNFGGSYHHLGRETCLAPVEWKTGGWPVVNGGEPIDTLMRASLPSVDRSRYNHKYTPREMMSLPEWVYLQNPLKDNYRLKHGKLRLTPHGMLSDNNCSTFIGRRQESEKILVETEMQIHECDTAAVSSSFGLSIYQINDGHIDFGVMEDKVYVSCKLKSLDALSNVVSGSYKGKIRLRITSDCEMYHFLCSSDGKDFVEVASLNCMLVSSEVAGGFTGVTIGMFAEGNGDGAYADFTYFDYQEQ
ncbi:MAG: glycoside hydrolase family 43 protein [Prevotella sp.]|nr:glycoside hydrolase family 43 protein [Prevotella sp.]